MFTRMRAARVNDLHFKFDEESGLCAVIAIHDTSRGAALGGCRFIPYQDPDLAVNDAIRLAQAMSYKAALADLDQGGGKSVIMVPPRPFDRRQLFQVFGSFIEELNGRYITAMDAGTTIADMDDIAAHTRYVTCTSTTGSPAPDTALGVFHGIEACLESIGLPMDKAHIAIQGLGHVGEVLVRLLTGAGAKLTVTDIDTSKVEQAKSRYGVATVTPDTIYSVDCDIFCPCGLGGILTHDVVSKLKCKIVAGAANNQLASPEVGRQLHAQNILYAPDYLINSGGLISVVMHYRKAPTDELNWRIANIKNRMQMLLNESKQRNVAPSDLANQLAEEILYRDTEMKAAQTSRANQGVAEHDRN